MEGWATQPAAGAMEDEARLERMAVDAGRDRGAAGLAERPPAVSFAVSKLEAESIALTELAYEVGKALELVSRADETEPGPERAIPQRTRVQVADKVLEITETFEAARLRIRDAIDRLEI